MAVTIAKERWTSKVAEEVYGSQGLKVGGETTLPFLHFEGEIPNRMITALEVYDSEPKDWPEILTEPFAGVLNDPIAWAKKVVEYGADMVALRLMSAHPDWDNASAQDVAKTAKAVADAVDVPLIVIGCGVEEKDGEILPVVAEALEGKKALIGCATANNYKSITAAANGYGHSVIASSPLDINLCKQLNILINEMGLPLDRIAFDPLVGALGYGIEYAYSIMERARMGALTGDKTLATPIVAFIGQEAWKAKEAKDADTPEWGPLADRAILWETTTAVTFAISGANIFVMRHPESVKKFDVYLDEAMKSNAY
ncbi:acetyl-CoA decarbonylase/synthase complex subunit delta [Phosphitispora sp. TUW77]|uniref:acetyl-CoA decarbonylase/synthase complex subunit delta n=1 Tax=Phosphitispora sp. TUW77 TaxID=3152361 RepID=UPI003AB6B693